MAAFSFHRSIRPHEKSPYGPIKSPISFAFSLLACRCAYLAAIPCMITLLRNAANASPQSNSELGSQPATSVYHRTHWEREGSPGVCAEGQNAGFVRAESASLGGWLAKLYGLRRFERSDKGWPMVDISQLMAWSAHRSPANLTTKLVASWALRQSLTQECLSPGVLSGDRQGCRSCSRRGSMSLDLAAGFLNLGGIPLRLHSAESCQLEFWSRHRPLGLVPQRWCWGSWFGGYRSPRPYQSSGGRQKKEKYGEASQVSSQHPATWTRWAWQKRVRCNWLTFRSFAPDWRLEMMHPRIYVHPGIPWHRKQYRSPLCPRTASKLWEPVHLCSLKRGWCCTRVRPDVRSWRAACQVASFVIHISFRRRRWADK